MPCSANDSTPASANSRNTCRKDAARASWPSRPIRSRMAAARQGPARIAASPDLKECPMTVRARFGTALLILSLAGCATTGQPTPGDPFERWNRGVHRFNDAVDRGVLKPVAKRYRKHVPAVLRTGVSNVLTNLAYPTTIINDLLQLKLKDTVVDLGRFAL